MTTRLLTHILLHLAQLPPTVAIPEEVELLLPLVLEHPATVHSAVGGLVLLGAGDPLAGLPSNS
jgi:hypothetical protein